MLFSIAREVGGMTVEELSRRISAREVREWMALWDIERREQIQAELEARATAGAHHQTQNPMRSR